MTTTQRAHLITGGFPPGSAAGHDMDYARLQLLQKLQAKDHLAVTVANDFQDIERWLLGTDFLITYVAGPYPVGTGNAALSDWLADGGRWFALHGTSGGKAVKSERDGRTVKKMVKAEHHQTLGCFSSTTRRCASFRSPSPPAIPSPRDCPKSLRPRTNSTSSNCRTQAPAVFF